MKCIGTANVNGPTSSAILFTLAIPSRGLDRENVIRRIVSNDCLKIGSIAWESSLPCTNSLP